MRRVLQRWLNSRDQDIFNLLDRDGRRAPWSRLVNQTVKTIPEEPRPPLANGVRRQPTRSSTAVLFKPSPQPSTIRERIANACDDFALRADLTGSSRSSSVRIKSIFVRPVRDTPRPSLGGQRLGCLWEQITAISPINIPKKDWTR